MITVDLKILSNYGKNISNVQFLGGGTLHMKGVGMFVVLLKGIKFWSLVSFRVFFGKTPYVPVARM